MRQTEEQVERVRRAYDQHHARLWRSLLAFSGSPSVADDAASEAFTQVLRRSDEVRDIGAWVWRAAFGIARGLLRDARRNVPFDGVDVGTVDEGLTSIRPAFELLDQLSSSDREIVVLCHIGGWRPSELAAVLGSTPVATRVRLHRATRRLRHLTERDEEWP